MKDKDIKIKSINKIPNTLETKYIQIRYRDSKGKISKFTKKKRLSVEFLFTRKVTGPDFSKRTVYISQKTKKIKTIFTSKGWTLPLRKRKKKVTIKDLENRIKRKLKKSKSRILKLKFVDGVLKVTYEIPKQKKRKRLPKKFQPWGGVFEKENKI